MSKKEQRNSMLNNKTQASPMENANYIYEAPAKNVATESMGLVNSGQLVKRIAEGAPKFQFVREFLQNCLDAGATRIEIGPDWTGLKTAVEMGSPPVYKLMFSDNGEGIPRRKMKALLNNLSSSGREMSADGNFGIGAKVAALPFNPFGIVFMSWTKEEDGMVRLFRRTDGNYGLFRWNESNDEEDKFNDLTVPPEDYRESWQKPSGTSVVLLGKDENEDTIFGPPEEEAGLQAILRIVNDRYFKFDDNVKVSVCVFDNATKSKWPKSKKEARYQVAKGAFHFLDNYSEDCGTIRSNNYNAKIHWWWHPNVKDVPQYASPIGYVGSLYNNELYDTVRKTKQSQLLLQSLFARFGIFYQDVWENVTIIVEPDKASDKNPDGAAPDLSRGRLKVANGESLPWDDYGRAFADNMPPVIAEAVAKASEGTESTFDLESKIKEYLDLMDIYTDKKASGSSGGSGSENLQKKRSSREKKDGEYRPTKYNLPDRQWVKPADLGDEDLFQGKAVHYQEGLNVLLFNEDFPLWKQMIDHWVAKYPSQHVRGKVREAVKAVYEAAVVTRIVHIRKFRSKADWSSLSIDKALSNESLTVAVLGIQDAYMHISNYLKGSVKMVRLDAKTHGHGKKDKDKDKPVWPGVNGFPGAS